jgi:PBP1b-binding outer membrane lipoprotein LpoB
MKKLVLFSTIVFSLLFLAGCGNKKADVSDTTTVDTTTTVTTEAGDASKNECLELMAYAFKVAILQAS